MPLTKIDTTPALVIIDLQKGITALKPMDEVIDNSVQLARAFRARGLPVVLVNVIAVPPGILPYLLT